MLQYVNRFSCISTPKNDPIIIHFEQNEPAFSLNTKDENVSKCNHKIASLIMDR